MKKVATFFAIAAVVAFSACGSKSSEETSGEAVDTTVTMEEPAPVAADTMPAPVDSVAAADTTAH